MGSNSQFRFINNGRGPSQHGQFNPPLPSRSLGGPPVQMPSLPPANANQGQTLTPGQGLVQTPGHVPVQTPKYVPAQMPKPAPKWMQPTPPRAAARQRLGQRRPGLFVSVLLGIMVLAVASFWFTTKGVPDVTLYEVNAQNANQYIGGGGIIFPRQQLDVSYPVAERIVAVPVKAGDQVTPNQPLIQLDPSQLNAQIKQASDDMDAARAYLNTVTLNGNSIAIAQAQQAYNISRDRYNELVAEATSPLVNKGNLISPMNGVVTTVDVNPGQVFAANTTLLTIMDESTVIVHVKVPLSNFASVHLGQVAIVTPSALPDVNAQGVVKAIIPQADPQTDTFEVWVEVVNSTKNLLPGMSAFVRIQGANQAFVLPRVAVLNVDHAPIVFVVRNQHAYVHAVRVVGHSAKAVFVGAGIAKGDKVVLVGAHVLHDGQAVHVRVGG